ncbi:uncharacterized protein PpBr36_09197 [Pyricularia pennisetigena]|uniref:uncharacterized protein n=1 Tax=Pyricularia pennisetigena TaxID=1578925 RepID=UPI00114E53D3|nr:uncharacterized protein PpBr36_09197 [Pyricularia pennisetigena]TLS21986.1 hypothetical protein PpBr36_09197 [Pyricularia pennisetigena]
MANPPTSETLPLGQHVSTTDAEFKLDLTTATSPTIELEDLIGNSRAPSTTSSGYLATDSGSNEMPSTTVTDEKSRSHASPSGSSMRSYVTGSQNGESSRRLSWMSGGSSTGSQGSQGSLRGDPRLRMVIRQRRESQNLRELGEFLRSKTPPPSNYMSRDDDPAPPPALSDLAKKNKKFSLKAVLARKPAPRENKGKQVAQPLQPIKLPDTAVAGRTTAGHRHIAISIPVEHSHLGPEIKSQYPIFEPENAPARFNTIESYYMDQVESLTGNVLRPVPELSGESDENEPDLINTSQASSPSSPCTPRTAAESRSSDFSAVSPKHLGAMNPEDRFPSSDIYRSSLSSEYPLEAWGRPETPMSDFFVTAPNSVKSVPSSPFETTYSQHSGVHTNDFAVHPLSITKRGLSIRHRRENPLREVETAWDADDSIDATAAQTATDEFTGNRLAAHWQRGLDSPSTSAVYTPPEHPDDLIHDDHSFEPAWERGRRLHNAHDLVKATDAPGKTIPGSPKSQRTVTPQPSSDNVLDGSTSPMEMSLREQDSGLGISTVYSSKQSSARKALAPIKTTDFDKGQDAAEPGVVDNDCQDASEEKDVPLRREFRLSQAPEPGQSTPTPWSANLEKQALQMERDVDSLLSRPPEDTLSAWGEAAPSSAVLQEPTPPNSPEDTAERALDKEAQQSPIEDKLKPRPLQTAETSATRRLPQQDRISLTRRIERRKKLAAAAAGARQASLFASIAEVEAKAKAIREQDASKERRNSLANPMSSATARPEQSRSRTDSESADQRVAEMERRVRQLEQQLEQSGEAWMGALMPLLTTLNKTLESQRAQQDMAAENLRRQRRRSSASDFGFGWGRYDESAEEPAASRRRNSMQRYLPEHDDDVDERLFVSRKGLSPAPSRQYRVLTPMEDEENDDDAAQAALQRMRGMRRRSLGSTSTGTFYGHSRKASTVSQDFEEDYDCGPRRAFGGEPHWQGLDRFGHQQPAARHWRFPSSSTIGTESAGSVTWSPGHGARRQHQQPPQAQQQQQQGKSSRRVSFASSMDFDPSRDDKKKKKKKSKRRESVGGAIDVSKKADDLYGLGTLMNELRDAARVSQEFLPESATVAGDEDDYLD